MVTSVVNIQQTVNGVDLVYSEFSGLSTDAKPTTGVMNGSKFFAMDTKKTYMFNGTASTWVEI